MLVGSVLLQPGKTDAGALFTSNVSSASLGPRGTASVLSKITIAAAATFMVTALLISLPVLSGDVSVLGNNPEVVEEAVVPADANTNTAAPANVDANLPAAAPEGDAPAINPEDAGIETAPAAEANSNASNN